MVGGTPTGYFVYGTVSKILRRNKVVYISFEKINDTPFTLVVFEPHFSHFTYKDKQLLGKDVLVYGFFKKNEFNGNKETEMVIKSNKYTTYIHIDFFNLARKIIF